MLSPFRAATPIDFSRLLLVAAIWGIAFVFIEVALQSFGPISVAALRITTAAAGLLIFSLSVRRLQRLNQSDWPLVLLIGFLNGALPFFLISWAQQHISAAVTSVLMATAPLSVLIISHLTTHDERINALRAIGLLVGFGGVLVLFWDKLNEGQPGALLAMLAVAAAGACYGSSAVFSRRLSHVTAVTLSTYTLSSACIYMLPLALIFEQPAWASVSLASWLAVLFLGLVATAFAYAMRFKIIHENGAVFMSQVGYLVPVFGVLWGWWLLNNELKLQLWLALALILLGIVITRRGAR